MQDQSRTFISKKYGNFVAKKSPANITMGSALSTIQNVENKAMENTLQLANLHHKHHQAVSVC